MRYILEQESDQLFKGIVDKLTTVSERDGGWEAMVCVGSGG